MVDFYNVMTCRGPNWDMGFFGDCTIAWFGLVILFFIIAMARKWIGEEAGLEFNFIFSLVFGFVAYLIVVALTGSAKWSLAAGILGMIVGGFLMGQLFGSGEESGGF